MHYVSHFIAILLATGTFVACSSGDRESSETTDAKDAVAINDNSLVFKVNVDASTLDWEGYKPTSKHTGTIGLSGGQLFVENDMITGGSTTIDMTSIEVTDLEGNSKTKLENHLRGTTNGQENDFFNVKEYPTAQFEITKVTALENNPDANAMIYGNLTMLGIAKNIGFHANISITEDKLTAATPLFTIDRTQWGIQHRSGSFFADLGDKLVRDEMGLKINLVAHPATESNLQ